jgi:hypothetical protein
MKGWHDLHWEKEGEAMAAEKCHDDNVVVVTGRRWYRAGSRSWRRARGANVVVNDLGRKAVAP